MHILNPILNNIEKQMKTEGAILVRGRLCIVDRGDSISMGETLFRYKVSGGDSVTARRRLCFGGRLYIVTPAPDAGTVLLLPCERLTQLTPSNPDSNFVL